MNYKDQIVSKSMMKNKLIFFLLLSIFFSVFSNAQTNIIGTWQIDKIVGVSDSKEYTIVKQKQFSWGNNLRLNFDGTFESRYSAPCGNDCFTSSSGRFIIIDDTHIRFILVSIYYGGWCSENLKSESDLNRDLGIFYIYTDSKSTRLIKSNGVLQEDKDKMLYTQLLKTFDENWKSYDYSWISTKSSTPEEIVKDCIDNRNMVDLSNCKILFSKKEGYGQLFLVQDKEDFHYVLYDDYKKKVSLAYPK